ncbi:hypothetical protein [Mucilaginibacter panaciglaebae]|uniref:NERD domain-containing protein n=1 Tax=Mucilaginibacter panaciglaebae TaxID=502331 RepID=A0ABP7W9V4_9SPHI
MSLKTRLYKSFPSIPKTNLAIGQWLYQLNVKRNKANVIEALSNQTDIYGNIGCGGAGIATGWVNIDFGIYENVSYAFDCKKHLPFANNSAKGLYTEHFFEHLDYFTEVPYFLTSCYRSLQKGGILRIVVPDAEKYLRGYCTNGWDALKKTRPLDDNLTDQLMGITYETKMQLVNEVFRQGGDHKYAWDYETLKLSLLKAGFSITHKMSYMQSNDPALQIDQLVREPESLYVEAIK